MRIINHSISQISIAVIAISLPFFLSCNRIQDVNDVFGEYQPVPVSIKVGLSNEGIGTKSAISVTDQKIKTMQIMAYNKTTGILDCCLYSNEPVTMNLIKGQTYHFYAVANMKRFNAPEYEKDIKDIRLDIPSVDAVSNDGLPMAYNGGDKDVTIREGNNDITLWAKRLVARYDLRINKDGLSAFDYTVKSVRIHQSAQDITPFRDNSTAITYSDWDHSTDVDVESLNKKGQVCFYVPENCMGRLLPNNTDPWGKVPSKLGSDAARCTYLSIYGDWRMAMTEGTLDYNLYLGQDATSDFSIVRNTASEIVIELTSDGAFLQSSWKVSRAITDDRREVHFDTNPMTVWCGEGPVTNGVSGNCTDAYSFEYPASGDVTQYLKFDTGSDGSLIVTPIRNDIDSMEPIVQTMVTMRSWDNVVFDRTEVIMKKAVLKASKGTTLYNYAYNDVTFHEIPIETNVPLADISISIRPYSLITDPLINVKKDLENNKIIFWWTKVNEAKENQTATITLSAHGASDKITTIQGAKMSNDGIVIGGNDNGGEGWIEF